MPPRWTTCLAIISSCSLAGCATVKTHQKAASDLGKGLNYYLPKRDAKFSAERTLLKKEEIEKLLAAKKAEEAATQKGLGEAKAKVKDLTATASRPETIGNPAALAQTQEDLALATAAQALLQEKIDTVAIEVKNLEASLAAVTAAPASNCVFSYSAKIELLPASADTRRRFVAKVSHNVLRDDETKLATTSQGLLSTANVVATDRTGDILVEIAGAVAAFGGIGPGSSAGKLTASAPHKPGTNCAQLPTKFSYRFDPLTELGTLNGELVNAEFPFALDIPSTPSSYSESSQDPSVQKQGAKGALFYRSAVPVTLVIRQCKNDLTCPDRKDSMPVEAAMMPLPQAGPLSFIPMRSSAFVKTVDDVTFQDGSITAWNANRPSEVLEVVRLPVKLLKAVVSVPAEIVKLRIDLSDQQKGLAEIQAQQIQAEEKYRALIACMKLAGDDDTAKELCLT